MKAKQNQQTSPVEERQNIENQVEQYRLKVCADVDQFNQNEAKRLQAEHQEEEQHTVLNPPKQRRSRGRVRFPGLTLGE
jgi:hypothetical protein